MDIEKFTKAYGESRNGANHFVRHPLARNFAYSDGVQECAECGLYWLLDILATELPAYFKRNEDVSNQCIVKVKDGPLYLKLLRRGSQPHLFTLVGYSAGDMDDVELEWATPVRFVQRK